MPRNKVTRRKHNRLNALLFIAIIAVMGAIWTTTKPTPEAAARAASFSNGGR